MRDLNFQTRATLKEYHVACDVCVHVCEFRGMNAIVCTRRPEDTLSVSACMRGRQDQLPWSE